MRDEILLEQRSHCTWYHRAAARAPSPTPQYRRYSIQNVKETWLIFCFLPLVAKFRYLVSQVVNEYIHVGNKFRDIVFRCS